MSSKCQILLNMVEVEVDLSRADIEHWLSPRRMELVGFTLCSMDRALDTVRVSLEDSTMPHITALGWE